MLTDPRTVDLIYILTALLVPIIPAVIFYRWFPSTADVSTGEGASGLSQFFHGIRFKLGGAFGGYFILMLVILWCRPTRPPTGEIWAVEGRIDSLPAISHGDEISHSTPQKWDWPGDNSFTTEIYVPRDVNGKLQFPPITFGRVSADTDTFNTATVHLDGTNYKDAIGKVYTTSTPPGTHNTIKINESIQLEKGPPYSPSGQAPAPIATP